MRPKFLKAFLLGILGWALFPAIQAQEDPTVILLRDGVVRGVILEENDREVLLRTWVGDKKIPRDNIVEIRRNLTAQERAAIVARINPWKDEQDRLARDREFARGKPVETPVAVAPARSAERRADGDVRIDARPRPEDRPAPAWAGSGSAGSWGERTNAALDRKITLELLDDSLEDALEFIASFTHITIILDPKVRALHPKVSLNVKAMDAAHVLKWLAKLTDTHIEVGEGALYVTDKPSTQAADEERNEASELLARHGLDANLLPPQGAEFTAADRTKLAMAIWEKENPKPLDFPGPSIGMFPNDPASGSMGSPFGGP